MPHYAPGPALSAVLRPYYLLLAFFYWQTSSNFTLRSHKSCKIEARPIGKVPLFLLFHLSLASPPLSCTHFPLPRLFCQFFIWFLLANCCKNSTFFVCQVKIEFSWGYWKINWWSCTIEKRGKEGGEELAIIVLIKFSNHKANIKLKLAWFYVLV